MRFFIVFLLAGTPLWALAQNEREDWFPLQFEQDFSTSVISMNDWLDAPAGKHGFVTMEGPDFRFDNGKKVKFWGVNISGGIIFSEEKTAHQHADYLAKYGVNAVRFHKFTWYAFKGDSSTQLANDKYERMDYFLNTLREKGIYYGWSPIYGHRLRDADRDRVLAYEEVVSTEFPWAHLNGSTASLVNFAPDLQEINIELMVNMLNHVNPLTGLRYADDPALNFIEFQNEDNIFWSAIEVTLEQTPTYRKLLCELFSDWLKENYGTEEALIKAWEPGALPEDEKLALRNIYPDPNHSRFDAEYRNALKEGRKIKQSYLDKARFLFEQQHQFYQKFVNAVRDTGYKGPIVASCWQAGSGITHYYNLYADYEAGFIDRHNYFGGGAGGHQLKPGKFNNEAMVANPGSGLLSSGLQQVEDRPFAFSEWKSLIPNQWTVEASPIIAVYGMGLQGWDASYIFSNDYPGFHPTLQNPKSQGVYNPDVPAQMGLFPTLSRMIYREDVKEGKVIHRRKVHIPSLTTGELGFEEQVSQDHDVKSFTGEVPASALAEGKVVVTFTDKPEETQAFESPNDNQKTLPSTTGQLTWDTTDKGFFTVDTPGTVGMVGFGGDKTHDFKELSLETSNQFAVIFASSLHREKSIRKSRSVLITTLAQSANTGMRYSEDLSELLEVGKEPLLLEPVRLTLVLKKIKNGTVHILDHLGRRTGQSFPFEKGTIHLDGAAHKTFYYELEWK